MGKNSHSEIHQIHCMTFYRLTDLTTRARKSHWLRGTKTHKVAFGSVLPRFSSWSWRSSCTRRTRVTLLPHIAFSTLGHQHMKCQSMRGEERMKLSRTGQRDGSRVTHGNARLSGWPRVSSFAVLALVEMERSVSVRPYLEQERFETSNWGQTLIEKLFSGGFTLTEK